MCLGVCVWVRVYVRMGACLHNGGGKCSGSQRGGSVAPGCRRLHGGGGAVAAHESAAAVWPHQIKGIIPRIDRQVLPTTLSQSPVQPQPKPKPSIHFLVVHAAAGRQYKGIRNVHRSLCSSVAFRPHKPWDLLSSGLDSTIAKYDFSRPKCIDRWDMAALAAQPGAAGGGGGQIFNPPFVHQVAVPTGESRPGCGWLAAARGDGAVVVLDADVSSAASGSSGPTSVLAAAAAGGRKGGGGGGGGTVKGKGKGGSGGGGVMLPLVLDRDVGGHTLPVCSVAWSPGAAAAAAAAGSTEAVASSTCRLYSGGEDCRVVVWDVRAALGARAAGRPLLPPPWQPRPPAPAAEDEGEGGAAAGGGGVEGEASGTDGAGEGTGQEEGAVAVLAEVCHGRKVNQLCTLGLDGKEFVAVAAISKFLVLYELRDGGA